MQRDDRISERRITFHDKNDKEMVYRHMRCLSTLVRVLDTMSYPHKFSVEYYNFRFACVPKLSTLEQVYAVNEEIAYQKVICDLAGITLFKIPRLVNDIDGYVRMLLREHYKKL